MIVSKTTNVRETPGVILKIKNLSIASNSAIDVNNHDLMIGNTTVAAVETLIGEGFGFTSTPGAPFISSTTAGTGAAKILIPFSAQGGGITSWDGVNVTEPNTVIAKYTYFSDLTFDNKVTNDDVFAVINDLPNPHLPAFGQPGFDWVASLFNGDVNFDGKVDGSDIFQVINDIPQGGQPLSGSSGLTSVSPSIGGGGSSAVPEPATLFLLGLGSAGMLLRRKRRSL